MGSCKEPCALRYSFLDPSLCSKATLILFVCELHQVVYVPTVFDRELGSAPVSMLLPRTGSLSDSQNAKTYAENTT